MGRGLADLLDVRAGEKANAGPNRGGGEQTESERGRAVGSRRCG